MARLDKLIEKFRACRGPFPWREFVAMIEGLGYERLESGKTGGSRRKFYHPKTKHKILCHEPHDGLMKPAFVEEMQTQLTGQQLL